ncbi:ABC transporter ATP-binding protein [Nocardioides yefusunii]|uniref:ABC transporter ATP-binding protein n=1 Tax=Nocardioides yefusunii TaxID=2500546 RepID=A0ABW1QZA8_9ACTN|nr:ABC transporter ATP-binding protein [Nocardioides yefusunii]
MSADHPADDAAPTGVVPPEVALAVEHVNVAYDGADFVRDVSLTLPRGEVLAVLGPSGSGKSTLLRAVAGLEPVTAGRVTFDGDDLARVPTHRRGFALMFQDGQLFDHLDVAGNVGYALGLRRVPKAKVAARVTELLDLVGLAGYGSRRPAQLSGGERQRVALARALAVEPRLLLLDEPLSALDAALRESLADDLRRILRASGTTAVMVTHDHEEAFAVADRLAVLFDGHLEQEGPIAQVWAAPATPRAAAFLGYAHVLRDDAARTVAAAAGVALGPAGVLAVRRSALRLMEPGRPGAALEAQVTALASTPEQVRLRVEVDGAGSLDAVAPLDAGAVVGAQVRLRVDVNRVAVVG